MIWAKTCRAPQNLSRLRSTTRNTCRGRSSEHGQQPGTPVAGAHSKLTARQVATDLLFADLLLAGPHTCAHSNHLANLSQPVAVDPK